ncbi:MAG: rod shape-determining protein, partial [Leuconostoc mesenteroides]
GGTTDVATISLGGIVSSRSIRIAGDKLDEAIANFVRNKYNVTIGEPTAERLKIEIGAASLALARTLPNATVRGRDLLTGLPKTIDVTAEDVATSIQEPVQEIVAAIRETLESTQPELAADVIDHGMILTGGGALLRDIEKIIQDATKVPVLIANEPLDAVAIGTGEALKSIDVMRQK